MRTLLFAIAATTVLSATQAFALAQENRGGGFCSDAKYICANADQSVKACVLEFADGDYVFTIRMDPQGHDIAGPRGTWHPASVPHGQLGAGVTFQSTDGELKIQTDAFPSAAGWPSTLTVPALDLNQATLRCKATN